MIHKQNMSVFDSYLTNGCVDHVHLGLVTIRKLIRLISFIKNPYHPLQAGKNILRQILFELNNIASIPAWASRSGTPLFCARNRFSSPTNTSSVSSAITVSIFHFCCSVCRILANLRFRKRLQGIFDMYHGQKLPTIAPGHNPVNQGFGVQKGAWIYHSAIAAYNFIWILLNAVSRFCNIYSCDGLCKNGHCCGDQGRWWLQIREETLCSMTNKELHPSVSSLNRPNKVQIALVNE